MCYASCEDTQGKLLEAQGKDKDKVSPTAELIQNQRNNKKDICRDNNEVNQVEGHI